ncbi:hypothetical protein [Saccharibacillus kuerlensis]|uniref:hypothetical protein n=1 Tax=Saccharibacillus kuerlensis TaxID=459527 RepID=UPI0012ED042B|nr:hypothetical protein [Saccharibacillus kuerlensis]
MRASHRFTVDNRFALGLKHDLFNTGEAVSVEQSACVSLLSIAAHPITAGQ